jgi:hypothetical protein
LAAIVRVVGVPGQCLPSRYGKALPVSQVFLLEFKRVSVWVFFVPLLVPQHEILKISFFSLYKLVKFLHGAYLYCLLRRLPLLG